MSSHFNPGTLILVDSEVTLRNSALKAMVKALPVILDHGWKVKVWSSHLDPVDDRIEWERVPRISRIFFIQFLFFSIYSLIRYFIQKRNGKITKDMLIQSTGAYLMAANVVNIQFVSVFYLAIAKTFPQNISLRLRDRIVHGIASLMERRMWSMDPHRRAWIVCSKRLAEDLRKEVKSSDLFEVLPNSYDPERFNTEVTVHARQNSRRRLGLKEDEVVFGFVCSGGFGRKGLPSALKICELLIQRGHRCQLLVIGGSSSHPPDISQFVAKAGIADRSFVVTHGRSPDVAELLSAADAFLFPSFFEAFANVEIEAAALGLRLYLTPHYGSEMIIRPGGINGRIISWDPREAAETIAAEIQSGIFGIRSKDCGEALKNNEFAENYIKTIGRIREYLG